MGNASKFAYAMVVAFGLASAPSRSQITAQGGIIMVPVNVSSVPSSYEVEPGREYGLSLRLDISDLDTNNEVDYLAWSFSVIDTQGNNVRDRVNIHGANRPPAGQDFFSGRGLEYSLDTTMQGQYLDAGNLYYPQGVSKGDNPYPDVAQYSFSVDRSLAGSTIYFLPVNFSAKDNVTGSLGPSQVTYSSQAQATGIYVVPEPEFAGIALGLGLIGFAAYKRMKKHSP